MKQYGAVWHTDAFLATYEAYQAYHCGHAKLCRRGWQGRRLLWSCFVAALPAGLTTVFAAVLLQTDSKCCTVAEGIFDIIEEEDKLKTKFGYFQ